MSFDVEKTPTYACLRRGPVWGNERAELKIIGWCDCLCEGVPLPRWPAPRVFWGKTSNFVDGLANPLHPFIHGSTFQSWGLSAKTSKRNQSKQEHSWSGLKLRTLSQCLFSKAFYLAGRNRCSERMPFLFSDLVQESNPLPWGLYWPPFVRVTTAPWSL